MDKFHIVTKSETEFIKFSKNMLELFPHAKIDNLTKIAKNTNAINITKYGE